MILALLLATLARADALCLLASDLREKIQHCENNYDLGRQADACLSALTAALKIDKPAVASELGGLKKKGGQAGSRADAADTYAKLDERLAAMVTKAELADAAVAKLLSFLFHPEDSDNPSLTGMSKEKYLASEACFAVPKQMMEENQVVIRAMLADLRKMKGTAAALKKKAHVETKLDSVTEQAHGKKGEGSGHDASSPKPGASDITGTEEDKAKKGQ